MSVGRSGHHRHGAWALVVGLMLAARANAQVPPLMRPVPTLPAIGLPLPPLGGGLDPALRRDDPQPVQVTPPAPARPPRRGGPLPVLRVPVPYGGGTARPGMSAETAASATAAVRASGTTAAVGPDVGAAPVAAAGQDTATSATLPATSGAQASPSPGAASGPSTLYVIPGCYAGDRPPDIRTLAATCDGRQLETITR